MCVYYLTDRWLLMQHIQRSLWKAIYLCFLELLTIFFNVYYHTKAYQLDHLLVTRSFLSTGKTAPKPRIGCAAKCGCGRDVAPQHGQWLTTTKLRIYSACVCLLFMNVKYFSPSSSNMHLSSLLFCIMYLDGRHSLAVLQYWSPTVRFVMATRLLGLFVASLFAVSIFLRESLHSLLVCMHHNSVTVWLTTMIVWLHWFRS
jgi:hypothetical protein